MDNENPSTLAILGAGPSGLVAAKEALANGLIPTVFEKHSDLGGVWNPKTGCTWDTLKTNISKFSTTFGDTDWPSNTDLEMFPSAHSMFVYLNDYADKWGLRPYIKFQCTVIKVSPLNSNRSNDVHNDQKETTGDQGWEVQWSTEENNQSNDSKVFTGVIIATGIFAEAHIPEDIKGLETFPGKVIHSKDYKTGSEFQGQSVLVVGGGFSGAEISGDVSNYTEKTIHCFRNPFWILKRYLPDSTRNNGKLPIDMVIFHNRNYFKNLSSSVDSNLVKIENEFCMTLCENQQQFHDLSISAEDLSKPINIVVSDQYLNQVRNNKLIPIKQAIMEVQGSQIKFKNGETYQVDAIILGTGFKVGCSTIFTKPILDTISYDQSKPDNFLPFILFKATFHPDLANLFFVGMYKGPHISVMEQQARWACKLLAKKVPLPPREVMMQGIQLEQKIKEQRPRPQLPHIDYFNLADEIATLSNGFPNLDKLHSDSFTLAEAFGKPLRGIDKVFLESKKAEITRKLMTTPVIPAHYNLVDNPEETLNQINFLEQVIKKYTE